MQRWSRALLFDSISPACLGGRHGPWRNGLKVNSVRLRAITEVWWLLHSCLSIASKYDFCFSSSSGSASPTGSASQSHFMRLRSRWWNKGFWTLVNLGKAELKSFLVRISQNCESRHYGLHLGNTLCHISTTLFDLESSRTYTPGLRGVTKYKFCCC